MRHWTRQWIKEEKLVTIIPNNKNNFGILVENQEQKLHNSNLNLAKLSCHKN